MAIFLMFYTLLLEKERMHTFKRYYLLTALIVALIIPSITFVEYVDVILAPSPVSVVPVETISEETMIPVKAEYDISDVQKSWTECWPTILWMVYGLGVLLFASKFIFNLRSIIRNVRKHRKIRINAIVHVLLKDTIVPYTFLNYIFLNRKKFEANEIPKEVLVHEAAHARQKHSLDVLFVELLQIVFWFNPLIHLVKKSIKLNHEFLADQEVLKQSSATSDYQNILLAYASSASHKDNRPSMANAINYSSYSSIKKRFKVMKTQTSKKSILLRTLLILPLLSLLLYGFSTTVQIRKEQSSVIALQEGATKKQIVEYNRLAKTYNTMLAEDGNIRIMKSDVDRLEYLHDLMTESQRANAEPFPDFPEPPELPEPPSVPNDDEGFALEVINRIIENQDPYDHTDNINLNVSRPPSPTVSHGPKSPLELLEELKNDNVKIILDGKEIDYEEARKQFEENTFSRINVSKIEGERPVLKVFSQ